MSVVIYFAGDMEEEVKLPWGMLAVPLLKHQEQAVSWMKTQEERSEGCGGLLADDQVSHLAKKWQARSAHQYNTIPSQSSTHF